MSRENPLWGAPRIHGELMKLGIKISEVSVPNTWCEIRNLQLRHGERSSAITSLNSPQSTSSPCIPSGLKSCSSLSFSHMIDAVLSTLPLQLIRQLNGL